MVILNSSKSLDERLGPADNSFAHPNWKHMFVKNAADIFFYHYEVWNLKVL